jgi:hypothetical protein
MGQGTVKVTLSADHFGSNAPTNIASGSFGTKGWSGTIGLGYQTDLKNGWQMDASLNASGLGRVQRRVDGAVQLSLAF